MKSILFFTLTCLTLITTTSSSTTTTTTTAVPSASASSSSSPSSSSLLDQLSSSPLHSLHIHQTYPHDVTHFTQGFAIDNRIDSTNANNIELYEGTGVWGSTYVHKYLLPSSGGSSFTLQSSLKLPNKVFGEGICLIEDKLLQLTWQNKRFHQFEKTLFDTITSTAPRLASSSDYHTIPYPSAVHSGNDDSSLAGWREGWGMTFNTHTQEVIVSDGSATLYMVKPNDLSKVVRKLSVHYTNQQGHRIEVDNLNELEYIAHPASTPQEDKGEIFANYYESYCILRIHPVSGEIKGILHADPKLFYRSQQSRGSRGHPAVEAMNGIAFHTTSQRLFVTGKLWKSIFEVSATTHVDSSLAASISNGAWRLDLAKYCPRLTMNVADMNYWQQVLAQAAAHGEKVEGKKRRANKPKQSSHRWTPVPPHSTAGKAIPMGRPIHSVPPAASAPSSTADTLPAVHSHAELSAETRATLDEGEEVATLMGHDDSHFDLDRYVAMEIRAMSYEAQQDAKDQPVDTAAEIVDVSQAMISGDIDYF